MTVSADDASVSGTGAVPDDLNLVDLSDPATYHHYDRRRLWERLREEDPVRRDGGDGAPVYWSLTRYEDVAAALKDAGRLVSRRGNVFATLLRDDEPGADRMVAVSDGKRHRALRTILNRAFAPRRLAWITNEVARRTDELVLTAVRGGSCDIVADVVEHIPMNTVCDLLDVPGPDRATLLHLVKNALSSETAGATEEDGRHARNEILCYFADLVDERREAPGDDIVSVLVSSMVDGEALDDDTVVLNCYSIVLGGDDTSRMAMAGGVGALADYPVQWARLRDGVVDVDSATEEVLRWTTPGMHFGRRAATDLEIGGHQVSEGDAVILWLASANLDAAAFDRPQTFNLGRSPNRHLTFGLGPHFCPGAFLGRTEVGALLTSLRRHVRTIERDGPERAVHSNFLQGAAALPVLLGAGS